MIPAERVRAIADEVLGGDLAAMGLQRGRGRRAAWTGYVAGSPRLVEIEFRKGNGLGLFGEFRVEVGAGEGPNPGGVPSLPLTLLLDHAGREEAGVIHDVVMRKARAAAPDADPRLTAPQGGPFPRGVEFFLPYLDEDDVRAWMRFVGDRLPPAMARLLAEVSAV